MIIDAHQHFWRYDSERDNWITREMAVLKRDYLPEDLCLEFAASRVNGSVAVQVSQSEQETLFLLDLAERHKEIVGVVGWVNLCDRGIRERLLHFSQFRKVCGFRHIVQSEPDDRFLVREDFCRGISALQEFNFTYDILIYPRQFFAAIDLVRRFPEQRFVIDHMAKPAIRTGALKAWARYIREIAAQPNVWCKLSGLVTEAEWKNWNPEQFQPFYDVVLKAFGPDRLIFGSDWPVCLLSGTYMQVKKLATGLIAELTAEQQEKIMGLNAVSFYNLENLSA